MTFFLNFIDVSLTYNAMLISTVQQNDSVIYIYIYVYIYIYTHTHILFHSGLSQDIKYSSLCYTEGPCCLSVLHIMVFWTFLQMPLLSVMHSLDL